MSKDKKQLQRACDELFQTMKQTSRLHFAEGFEFEKHEFKIDNYTCVPLYGGLNSGTGKWSNYFSDISILCVELQKTFEQVWLINIDVDTDDDVFSVEIGVR